VTKTGIAHAAGLAVWICCAALSVFSIRPLAPLPKSAPADAFSSERAVEHLDVLARAPRAVGTAAHEEARAYIVGVLERLGLEVRVHEAEEAVLIAGNVSSAWTKNVIGRLRGTRGTGPAVALVAHYDTVPQSPGASDDGSGVVVLLETARALSARARLDADILFVFTDAEEMGLLGARAVVGDGDKALGDVGVALNFDARGSHGAVAMYDVSAGNGALIEALAEAAPRPITSAFICALAKVLPNDSDVSVFKKAGIPVLGFAYADGLQHYHRATDDTARLDPASVQHGGSYALALATYFAQRPIDRLVGPDVVFFDVLGRAIVRYSIGAARAFACVTLVLLIFIVLTGRRAGRLTLTGLAKGAATLLFGLFASAIAVAATQWGIGRFVDFYMRAARVTLFAWHAVLLSLAVLVTIDSRALRKTSARDLAAGAALAWGLLLAVAAVVAPALTAPLEWPLFFWLAGSSAWLLRMNNARATAALYAGSVPLIVMMSGIVYSVFVATGATMAFAPILLVAFSAPLLLPLLGSVDVRHRSHGALVAVAGSLLLAGVGCMTARYGASDPRADSIVYAFDVDTRSALWITHDERADAWTSQFVPADAIAREAPRFTRSTHRWRSATAPVVALDSTRIEVLVDEKDAKWSRSMPFPCRRLTLSVRVPETVRCVHLWDDASAIVSAETVAGEPVRDFVRFSPALDETLMRLATGDSSRRVWHMDHCDAGVRHSFEVQLVVRESLPIHLRVVAESSGLPDLQDRPPPRRTPGLVPAGGSDVTLVSRLYSL